MDDLDITLNHLLDTPADSEIDTKEVATLTERCPAFLLPFIMMLRHPHPGLTDEQVSALVTRVALSLPDRRRLIPLLDPEGTGKYDRFYPPAPHTSSPATTNDVIDSFLNIYGKTSPEEEALISRMIFNPVPDYAATLELENTSPAPAESDQDRLLDAFIAADKNFTPAPIEPAESETALDEPTDNVTEIDEPSTAQAIPTPGPNDTTPPARQVPPGSSLSESLARIFIKQHNYRRAYEIIESLSLNYPEKSVYFADQLRFLGKIIKNREAQERNK